MRRQPPYAELGLDDPSISDDQLLDAMLAYPILIDCPIVVTQLERAVPSSKRPKLAVSSLALQKRRLIQPFPEGRSEMTDQLANPPTLPAAPITNACCRTVKD